MRHRYAYFLILLLGFTVYSNVISLDFARDDAQVVYQNNYVINGLKNWQEILLTPRTYGMRGYNDGTYRPLAILSHALDWQLVAYNPQFMHAINLLLYLALVLFLYNFATIVLPQVLALIASIIFLLHPVHVEVVANIKGRDELLAALFLVLTCTFHSYYLRSLRTIWLIPAFFSFILALLSKETSILLPVLITAAMFCFTNISYRKIFYISGIYFLIAAIFWIVRMDIVTAYEPVYIIAAADENILGKLSFLESFPTCIYIIAKYFLLMVNPSNLLSDYSYSVIQLKSFYDYEFVLSAIFLIALINCLFIRSLSKVVRFSIFAFFLLILPVSNLFIKVGTIMGERLLFSPSIFLALIIAYFFYFFQKTYKLPAILLVILLCLFYCKITYQRNFNWQNSITLASHDLKRNPNSAKYHRVMGAFFESKVRYNDCIEHFKKALSIVPDYSAGQTTFLKCYVMSNQLTQAKDFYLQYTKQQNKVAIGYHNLGVIYGLEGNYDLAIKTLWQGIYMDLNLYDSWLALANVYKLNSNPELAERCLKIARSLQN